jgi:hypothetical protein
VGTTFFDYLQNPCRILVRLSSSSEAAEISRQYLLLIHTHLLRTALVCEKNDVVAAAIYLVQKLEEQVHRFASFSVMSLAT